MLLLFCWNFEFHLFHVSQSDPKEKKRIITFEYLLSPCSAFHSYPATVLFCDVLGANPCSLILVKKSDCRTIFYSISPNLVFSISISEFLMPFLLLGSVELDDTRERVLNFATETIENKGGDYTMYAMGKMMVPSQVFLWRFKVFVLT